MVIIVICINLANELGPHIVWSTGNIHGDTRFHRPETGLRHGNHCRGRCCFNRGFQEFPVVTTITHPSKCFFVVSIFSWSCFSWRFDLESAGAPPFLSHGSSVIAAIAIAAPEVVKMGPDKTWRMGRQPDCDSYFGQLSVASCHKASVFPQGCGWLREERHGHRFGHRRNGVSA